MAIDKDLVDILRCVENGQSLRLADQQTLDSLNEKIRQGALAERSGGKVDEPLQACLVREDNKLCYPVRNDIPLMILSKAIEMRGVR